MLSEVHTTAIDGENCWVRLRRHVTVLIKSGVHRRQGLDRDTSHVCVVIWGELRWGWGRGEDVDFVRGRWLTLLAYREAVVDLLDIRTTSVM